MRNRVVLFRRPDVRVSASISSRAKITLRDARDVGAVGQRHQVRHQVLQSFVGGTSVGRVGSSIAVWPWASVCWMRFSISRTESRYSFNFSWSPAPKVLSRRAGFHASWNRECCPTFCSAPDAARCCRRRRMGAQTRCADALPSGSASSDCATKSCYDEEVIAGVAGNLRGVFEHRKFERRKREVSPCRFRARRSLVGGDAQAHFRLLPEGACGPRREPR